MQPHTLLHHALHGLYLLMKMIVIYKYHHYTPNASPNEPGFGRQCAYPSPAPLRQRDETKAQAVESEVLTADAGTKSQTNNAAALLNR